MSTPLGMRAFEAVCPRSLMACLYPRSNLLKPPRTASNLDLVPVTLSRTLAPRAQCPAVAAAAVRRDVTEHRLAASSARCSCAGRCGIHFLSPAESAHPEVFAQRAAVTTVELEQGIVVAIHDRHWVHVGEGNRGSIRARPSAPFHTPRNPAT